MDKAIYIPRNHKVEEAPENVAYTQSAPETDRPYKTFFGTKR
jgi:hypothetical protein